MESPFAQSSRQKSEVLSIGDIKSIFKSALERAEFELEQIKDSLKDLASRIESERPEFVVFLDMSARIFGTAFLQVLSERMGSEAPSIIFYNDDRLKGAYLDKGPWEDIARKDFSNYAGKKVFVVDETFSSGKGATALLQAADLNGVSMHYFALTRDPDPTFSHENSSYAVSDEEHEINVKKFITNENATIYENKIKNLFSRWASRLYLTEWRGETLSSEPVEQNTTGSKNSIPDANDYVRPPDGMTMQEYEREMRALTYDAVRSFKQKIRGVLSAG